MKVLKIMASVLKSRNRRPFTVIVEGNIGSGKTTFLEYFRKYKGVNVLAEPIDMWRNCDGHNLLGHMYEDPQKWAFTFQSYVMLTMLEHHSQVTDHTVKLMERSIYSARYCFVEKMYRDGLMPAPALSVLNEWFKWSIENTKVDVDLVVYLRTSPEVVYERMMKRNRKEEKSIPFEYIKDLHDIHESWLYTKTLHKCPAPVIMINADLDKSIIAEEYEKCTPSILSQMVDVC